MDGPAKRKVTAKVTPSTSPSRTNSPRPPSPIKRADSSPFRPKAKVNSSVAIRRSPSVVSVTPRAGSPTKVVRANNGTLSPTFQPRVLTSAAATAKVTLRPQTPVSAPGTPAGRQRTLTQSEVGKNVGLRELDGSFSLHHAMSFSSLQTASQDSNASPPLRIRSKVSNLSKAANENVSPSALSPSRPAAPSRFRSPSSSSSVSQMANNREITPQYYPITTGSPAANPHRYGQAGRLSPMSGNHACQGLALLSNGPTPVRPRFGGATKVDLTSTPPPPLSPPGSTLSFSSRSSVSQSSTSQADSLLNLGQSEKRRESGATEIFKPPLDSSSFGDSQDKTNSGPESNDNEVKVRAAAKTNRKIADLEITNRSLLGINASLEAAKNKQAKEIRDLRRKLRESRLILPPRAYLAVKSSMGPDEDDDGDEDEDDDSELEEAAAGDGDEIYKRVKLMLEGLISTGKKALETKVEDFPEGGKGIAKVLTAEEVQSWHRSNKVTTDIDTYSELESEAGSTSISQADSSIFSSVNGDEDDDDISFFGNDTFLNPTGPPIHVSEAQ